MNNTLSNNATSLAVSSVSMDDFDFLASCKRCALRKLPANQLTTVALTMGRSKLIAAVCSDFKSHYPSVFEKRDSSGNRVPSERLDETTYERVSKAVDAFLEEQFSVFTSHKDELVKVSSRFAHLSGKKDVIMRHTIQRDEVISLKERRFGITLFIGETERQIEKYNKQSAVMSEVTMERVKKLEKRLVKEQETLANIDLQIAQQKTVS